MNDSRSKSRYQFAFISTCPEMWGGSEELWVRAATELAGRAHKVIAFKTGVDRQHPRITNLIAASGRIWDLDNVRTARRVFNLFLPAQYQISPSKKQAAFLAMVLKAKRPDLVTISQGDNYDGVHFGELCLRLKIRYALISQKATDYFWPRDPARARMRRVYESAERCYFVSNHNRELTEDQIGIDLPRAEIIRNPYLIKRENELTWPEGTGSSIRLACVGRLFLLDKGQDIALRVLASEKWRERDLSLTFFGDGINRDGLESLSRRLKLANIKFAGQTQDIDGIWNSHHALIMPSRGEGLPLSLVEAMLSGRIAIATDVGGNSEVIEDNVTGFIAATASVSDFDEAMERAWARRSDWPQMGRLAGQRIRDLVPENPVEIFANKLIDIAAGTNQ